MYFNKKGFTLAELMAVIAITAILIAVAIPTFIGAKNRSNASACRTNLEIIKSAFKEWALDNPDAAIANHDVTVAELNNYIDSGFSSLKEPTTDSAASYIKTDNTPTGLDDGDIVFTLDSNGNIPSGYPKCNTGKDGHTL